MRLEEIRETGLFVLGNIVYGHKGKGRQKYVVDVCESNEAANARLEFLLNLIEEGRKGIKNMA